MYQATPKKKLEMFIFLASKNSRSQNDVQIQKILLIMFPPDIRTGKSYEDLPPKSEIDRIVQETIMRQPKTPRANIWLRIKKLLKI